MTKAEELLALAERLEPIQYAVGVPFTYLEFRMVIDSIRLAAQADAQGGEVVAACDWPGKPFSFHDDPGEHNPCYVVMPDGAMLALNHHAAEGVDIARAKFIVAACNAALSNGLPPSPMAIEVIVTEAMQDSWNDICSDTGCHPLDIKQLGSRRLEFHVGHWARQTAKRVAAILTTPPLWNTRLAAQADAQGGEVVAWPKPVVTNPDIANPTNSPYLNCLIHRLLDAQQDINLYANENMSQSLCDASALIDEVERVLRAVAPPLSIEAQRAERER